MSSPRTHRLGAKKKKAFKITFPKTVKRQKQRFSFSN